MYKKFLPILFIVSLVGLIFFQKEVVLPFAEWVASSDIFLENSGDEGSRIANSSPMTNHAFNQCNIGVRNEIDEEISINFPNVPLQSWSLGNYKYLINAEIELTTAPGESFFKKYACQIQYDDGSDLSEVMDSDNWDISGLSGISSL
jgi:hypothetical protein